MKFIGSVVGVVNFPMFVEILSKLIKEHENIDRITLRYALPSMRYFLSVHQMHKSNSWTQ